MSALLKMPPVTDCRLVIRIEETRNYIRLINEIHYIYRWLYGSPMEP